jgi:23S rRNA U2552 (ribose-2'-O)-methylase RlmE/FtsJ
MSYLQQDESYKPIIFEINKNKDDILSHQNDITVSSNIDYPRFEYCFHHFIHSDKNKMKILDTFKDKKKVYYVMNEFERYVDDYNKDLGNLSYNFFNLKNKPNIMTRSFYKMWEILFYFDLIDKKSKSFTSMNISNGPTAFTQAIMFYRDKYSDSKKDSYNILSSKDDNKKLTKGQSDFKKHYKKVKYIDSFDKPVKNLQHKVHLITGDRGIEWNNENIQEQESFLMIFEQILCAVKYQKKGGHFICKFFETFTNTSLKFVSVLTELYDSVHFVKPLMSRKSNSEKYAVCMGFKYGDKKVASIEKKLEKMYKEMLKIDKNNYLVDVFTDFKIDNDFKNTMIKVNKTVANEQLKSINIIIKYVEGMNYHGDVYRLNRDKQIKATEYWNKLFFTNKHKIVKI